METALGRPFHSPVFSSFLAPVRSCSEWRWCRVSWRQDTFEDALKPAGCTPRGGLMHAVGS